MENPSQLHRAILRRDVGSPEQFALGYGLTPVNLIVVSTENFL